MTETYTAWDGKEYSWPPPDGWVQRSDGRYWPAEEAAAAPPSAATPPPASTPPPAAAPPPAVPPPAAPTPQPIPVPQQQSFDPGPPPEIKSSKTGMIVLLSIFGVLVLMFGGCTFFVFRTANSVSDGIDEFGESIEEFEENQIEARNEVSIEDGSCSIVDGQPTATVIIQNRSGGRSDYRITVTFTDGTGRRLTSGSEKIDSIDDGLDIRADITSIDTGLAGVLTCAVGDVIRTSSDTAVN